jgi:DNA-binding NtrC family response regulator
MAAPRPNILIIEDDDLQYEIYAEALEDFELTRVKKASEGFKLASENPPSVILLDHILEDGELGLKILPEFKELLPFVPIIIVSGALEVHQQLGALQGPRRADWCITKPVDVVQLVNTVKKALRECGEEEVVRQFEALERSKRVDADELMSRSSDRLSRQRTIRQQLEGSSDRPNISGLARQFNVARRTIIRDLNELIRRGELPAEVYPERDAAESEL